MELVKFEKLSQKISDANLLDFVRQAGSDSISILIELELSPMRNQEINSFLEQAPGVIPRWLPTARCFVTKLTAQQIRQVAGFESVRAIWPDRRL